MPVVRLPANNWRPRDYQFDLWSYLERGGKRASAIWHRRAGKDELCLNWGACSAHTSVGNILHMLPQAAQARKAIWTSVNPHSGKRRIVEAFPENTIENILENEMFIRFKVGSTWQVVGSDNYKNLVGGAPNGIVFSEWAKADPGAWPYLSPILAENNGWAAFITTPEGKNHAYKMHEAAKRDTAWFAQTLTVDHTKAISKELIEDDRQIYIEMFGQDAADALIQQEYWCSFNAAILGSYWAKDLERLNNAGNICELDIVNGYPISTAWDIGIDDPMAIWVFQAGPGWLHIIDYCEGSGYGFDFYCDWLDQRGYKGGVDYVPHDARQREPGSPNGRTRIETLITLGRNPKLVPDHKPIDRINAARRLLAHKDHKGRNTVYFDQNRCKRGLECLENYKQEWDEKNTVWRKTPQHNWASHGADAFGHLAVAVEVPQVKKPEAPRPTHIKVKDMTVNDLIRLTRTSERRVD